MHVVRRLRYHQVSEKAAFLTVLGHDRIEFSLALLSKGRGQLRMSDHWKIVLTVMYVLSIIDLELNRSPRNAYVVSVSTQTATAL